MFQRKVIYNFFIFLVSFFIIVIPASLYLSGFNVIKSAEAGWFQSQTSTGQTVQSETQTPSGMKSHVSKKRWDTQEPHPELLHSGCNLAAQLQSSFTEVAKKVGPAVVSISTIHREKVGVRRYYFGGPFADDFFDSFFRDFFESIPEQREFEQRGLGSGVIISKDGLILTNEHVVRGADEITVTLSDGRKFKGAIKGTDLRSDLAVIKIKAKGLPYAELGDSEKVKIGQWAIAIGNPFGYLVGSSEPTVTVGVVSAVNRSIIADRNRDYTGLIQTDAAINPGNSGGPLVDIEGRIMGINVAIFSTSGGYQGVGFAVPVNKARQNLSELIEGKKILYGWLGVLAQDVNEELAKVFNLPDARGAVVAKVLPGSPAEEAGINEQDVIIRFDNRPVNNVRDLLENISRSKVGSKVTVSILRKGEPLELDVNITARPEDEAETEVQAKDEIITNSWRGIEVCDITSEKAGHFGIEAEEGVVIWRIEPDSPAIKAGLRAGDVIEQINRAAIRDTRDFCSVVVAIKGDALIRTTRGYTIVKEK